jgi:hypothetical protein
MLFQNTEVFHFDENFLMLNFGTHSIHSSLQFMPAWMLKRDTGTQSVSLSSAQHSESVRKVPFITSVHEKLFFFSLSD